MVTDYFFFRNTAEDFLFEDWIVISNLGSCGARCFALWSIDQNWKLSAGNGFQWWVDVQMDKWSRWKSRMFHKTLISGFLFHSCCAEEDIQQLVSVMSVRINCDLHCGGLQRTRAKTHRSSSPSNWSRLPLLWSPELQVTETRSSKWASGSFSCTERRWLGVPVRQEKSWLEISRNVFLVSEPQKQLIQRTTF